jgi:predicted RecB family nuclease
VHHRTGTAMRSRFTRVWSTVPCFIHRTLALASYYKRLQMICALTSSLLEDYLRCESKSYLRLQGRHGQTTDYSVLCAQLDAHHRASALQWLVAQSTTVGVRRFGGLRLQDLATGHAMILDAVAGADGLETHFDGLQREPGDSPLGPYYYRPIRFCRNVQPGSTVHLLLAFDALILGHLQGPCPDDGILICGPAFKRIRIRLRTHLDSLATVLTRLRLQTDHMNEPSLVLNRHCDICEFKQLC